MEMDERKIKILQAIILDYIDTAEPVGSRTIAKKYDLGISSATIRNEMADLEEMGYLEQLHSSSGRKPSDKGYRLYVDKLMQVSRITYEEEEFIKKHIIKSTLHEIDKVIKEASYLLAELTRLTSVVKSPSLRKGNIKSIQLIQIDNINILLVMVIDTGVIKNNLIRMIKPINTQVLTRINSLLNIRLSNLNIEEINLDVINNLRNDLFGYEDIFNSIMPVIYESLSSMESSDIYFQGTTNIFHYPEYNDIQRAKEFLALIDNKKKINDLINSTESIDIKIGGENFLEDAKECSIVSAVYSIGGRPLGSIGVIGPTRMPYDKVISILEAVVNELNKTLTDDYMR